MTKVKTGYLKRADVSLYYEVRGNAGGVPLFVINGGPGRSHNCLLVSPVWDELAKARAVVFYDQRGTGLSTEFTVEDSCTLEEQIQDLEALQSHLGFEEIDLLGHSWGGYLSMAYTARCGQRVRRLILVGSAAPRIQETVALFGHLFPEIAEQRKEMRDAMKSNEQTTLQESERLYFSMLCCSQRKRDAFVATADTSDLNLEIARKLGADVRQYDFGSELLKFNLPTLVLTGRFDANVAPSVAYKIHKAIAASRLHVFEGSGHLPFYEEPEEFARIVSQFLTESSENSAR